MIQAIIICIFFGFLYALKGGSGNSLFGWWADFRAKNWLTERLLDGKVISTLGAFLFGLVVTSDLVVLFGDVGVPEYRLRFQPALMIAAGWLAGVAPSMGEEHGAIGRFGYSWGPYISDSFFGRMYGIKKGLQRGVWMGACMTLATGFVPFILTSLLFVPAVFIGQEITYRLTGRDGWALSEPIIGALVFGLGFALWLS